MQAAFMYLRPIIGDELLTKFKRVVNYWGNLINLNTKVNSSFLLLLSYLSSLSPLFASLHFYWLLFCILVWKTNFSSGDLTFSVDSNNFSHVSCLVNSGRSLLLFYFQVGKVIDKVLLFIFPLFILFIRLNLCWLFTCFAFADFFLAFLWDFGFVFFRLDIIYFSLKRYSWRLGVLTLAVLHVYLSFVIPTEKVDS